MEIKHIIDKTFAEETAKLIESNHMKSTFRNINICAVVKNKNSITNVVVKTRIYKEEVKNVGVGL